MRTVTDGDIDIVCIEDCIVVAEIVNVTDMLAKVDRDNVMLADDDELNDGEGEVVPQ